MAQEDSSDKVLARGRRDRRALCVGAGGRARRGAGERPCSSQQTRAVPRAPVRVPVEEVRGNLNLMFGFCSATLQACRRGHWIGILGQGLRKRPPGRLFRRFAPPPSRRRRPACGSALPALIARSREGRFLSAASTKFGETRRRPGSARGCSFARRSLGAARGKALSSGLLGEATSMRPGSRSTDWRPGGSSWSPASSVRGTCSGPLRRRFDAPP